MSILEEVLEEDVTAEQDDQMPQLLSQASRNHHEQEQDDAVTLKNPKILATQDNKSDESTAAEVIGSDDGNEATEDGCPQYTSPPEISDVEYLKSTQIKGNHQDRVSQS